MLTIQVLFFKINLAHLFLIYKSFFKALKLKWLEREKNVSCLSVYIYVQSQGFFCYRCSESEN